MSRFEGGYVKLYRALLESDIACNAVRLSIFLHLIAWANWKDSQIEWLGKPFTLKRGQLITTLREIGNEVGTDKDCVKKHLDYLCNRDTISLESTTRGTVISIKNYETYQSDFSFSRHELDTFKDSDADANIDTGTDYIKKIRSKERKERKHTARIGIRAEYTPEFEKLWTLYGKVGKKCDAYKAFNDSKLKPEEYENLTQAVPRYLADCVAKDRKFQHLATFLRSDWRPYLELPLKPSSQPSLPIDPTLRALREAHERETAERGEQGVA